MVLYVLVHEHCIWEEYVHLLQQGRSLGRIPSILQELQRIRIHEPFVEVRGDPHKVLYSLQDKVLVCGAYGEMCVRNHVLALHAMGQVVDYHDKGILFAQRDLLLPLPAVDFCYMSDD